VRVTALLVLVGPPVAAVVLELQTGLPTDTLYGRWVHDIGLAFPLVLLGSAALWGIPVLASIVAGDLLSSEDAHGTWATLLTRSRTRWQLFAGKVVVAALTTAVLLGVLAVSSVLSGLVVTGRQPLVGLTGQPIGFGHAVWLVGGAWLSTLPVALAVSAGALLVSAASRNSLVGVTVPAVVGAVLTLTGQLAALGGLRPLLLTPGLTAWHGLLTEGTETGPVLWSALASLGWAGLFLGGTVLVLRRRDWAVP
jgi:ABC-2 type transport system permease protein